MLCVRFVSPQCVCEVVCIATAVCVFVSSVEPLVPLHWLVSGCHGGWVAHGPSPLCVALVSLVVHGGKLVVGFGFFGKSG